MQVERTTVLKTEKFVHWLPLALAVVALPMAFAAFFFAVIDDPDQIVYEQGTFNSREAADIAAQALERAEQNNETANTILSLLEGGSVLLTLIVGAVAITYTLNLRDLREDMEERAEANEERVRNTLSLREAELNNLSQELRNFISVTDQQFTKLTTETQTRLEGMTALITEQLEDARIKAEKSFRVLSLQLLAEQQVRARNYDTAIQTLQDAYELDDDNQTTNYLLGYLYIARRKFEGALDHLTRALKDNQDFAPALAAMGLAQRRLGDQEEESIRRNRYYAEAEVNLLKALETDGGMVDADGESYFGTLGGLYRRQNRNQDALQAYEKAVEVTPKSSYPIGNLAVLYKRLGRDEEAKATFTKAQLIAEDVLETQPNDYWAELDLAQALLVQEKSDEALKKYRTILRRDPSIAALKSALSTLKFLAESPTAIPKITDVIELIDKTIDERQAASEST